MHFGDGVLAYCIRGGELGCTGFRADQVMQIAFGNARAEISIRRRFFA
jgi:hypothetical protein